MYSCPFISRTVWDSSSASLTYCFTEWRRRSKLEGRKDSFSTKSWWKPSHALGPCYLTVDRATRWFNCYYHLSCLNLSCTRKQDNSLKFPKHWPSLMEVKSTEVSRSQYERKHNGKNGTQNFTKEFPTDIVLHYASCASDDIPWSQLVYLALPFFSEGECSYWKWPSASLLYYRPTILHYLTAGSVKLIRTKLIHKCLWNLN